MKALIVDDVHKVMLEKFEQAGIDFIYLPNCSRQEADKLVSDCEILIIRSKFSIDEIFIAAAKKLKIIGRPGAGMDNIDEIAATKQNIQLYSANAGNCDAVAEHMIGMLLSLLNHLNRADAQVKNGQWRREDNRGMELKGKTVAIIGYGHNGQAMAKKLSGFDVNVIAYDKYKTGFSDTYVQEVSMEQVVRQADVLSFHIPLTRETTRLVDREYLYHFRKPIIFLMGARGRIVDIPAVLESLDSKKIIAAAFDVLPIEHFPELAQQDWFDSLIARDNVLVSPHVAGWTVESYYKLSAIIADKVIDATQ